MAKKVFKIFYIITVFLAVSVITVVVTLCLTTEDEYKISSSENFKIPSPLPVSAVYEDSVFSEKPLTGNVGERYNVNLKLFGVIPVRKVSLEVVDSRYVAVLGIPFGIRLYTNGVLVVDMTDIEINGENKNPAKSAGIKLGDYIVSIDGEKVTTNEKIQAIIENSGGKTLNFEINRNGKTLNLSVTPVCVDETGLYKAGIWVLDSTAGIGMLTFYSPADNVICGLGHPICDSNTGKIYSFNSGDLVSASIISVNKGVSGKPGELKGKLTGTVYALLKKNCEQGVFGNSVCNVSTKNLTEVAFKQEVTDGEATVISTVIGEEPQKYSCTVKVKNVEVGGIEQNLIVKITDQNLLDSTGGIVQGMSGSPIVQNGKLIGAITHVLVDDPTTGYAIFAENMLETAQGVANKNKLKEVS